MKFGLLVCGKLKSGPETDLVTHYLLRAKQQGRALSISDIPCQQVAIAAGSSVATSSKLAMQALPPNCKRVVLDETGKNLSTTQFSSQISQWRDQGIANIVLMVGPADGWDKKVLQGADLVLSFGKLTWPHKLAQVMAAEQIYRVICILSGSPYHRGQR